MFVFVDWLVGFYIPKYFQGLFLVCSQESLCIWGAICGAGDKIWFGHLKASAVTTVQSLWLSEHILILVTNSFQMFGVSIFLSHTVGCPFNSVIVPFVCRKFCLFVWCDSTFLLLFFLAYWITWMKTLLSQYQTLSLKSERDFPFFIFLLLIVIK